MPCIIISQMKCPAKELQIAVAGKLRFGDITMTTAVKQAMENLAIKRMNGTMGVFEWAYARLKAEATKGRRVQAGDDLTMDFKVQFASTENAKAGHQVSASMGSAFVDALKKSNPVAYASVKVSVSSKCTAPNCYNSSPDMVLMLQTCLNNNSFTDAFSKITVPESCMLPRQPLINLS